MILRQRNKNQISTMPNPLNLKDVTDYVEANIETFHKKRIEGLNSLKLKKLLKRKNPYLFKAKHVLTAGQIVAGITSAYASSQEETIFGDWLEGLAIYVNNLTYGGFKSGIPNIDLEFEDSGIRYIVNIKSGPNWGNSSQIDKMVRDFAAAKRTLSTSGSKMNIVAVNGCCYGQTRDPNKGNYFKYCGQDFWHFISGDKRLFVDIIEPLGHNAKKKNEEFEIEYVKQVNLFTAEFLNDFSLISGDIDWEKIVRLNSQSISSS